MRASVAIQEGEAVTRSLVDPLTCTMIRRSLLDTTSINLWLHLHNLKLHLHYASQERAGG